MYHFYRAKIEKSWFIIKFISTLFFSGEVQSLLDTVGLPCHIDKESLVCQSVDQSGAQHFVLDHIARLKQQGLIRHVGSNKTGGYEAVEGEMG